MPASVVDSHCHLDFPDFQSRLPDVLASMRDAGVSHALCVAVTLENLHRVLALADTHDHLFASVGVHPDEEHGADPDADTLVRLASASSRIVAIGETGLDYFRRPERATVQQVRFRAHIAAARITGKPLIVHTRNASADTIAILRGEGASAAGGVMHCFTESWEVARAALDLGFYISFSGIVTFKNAEDLRQVARQLPSDRILVETDSPYLAPVPHRGKTNEPAFVRHVATFLADLRGEDADLFAERTSRNFFDLFKTASPV